MAESCEYMSQDTVKSNRRKPIAMPTIARTGRGGALMCVASAVLLALALYFAASPAARQARAAGDGTALLSSCKKPGGRIARGWPDTDFTRCTINIGEIISGGPGKDGIPAVDAPKFARADELDDVRNFSVGPREPVIQLTMNGHTRAYPLSVLIWHEIVNDTVGGVPVSVTYCPLCNTAIVFDRRLESDDGPLLLDFGTTGNLRKSDLVMYDRQTESWWQQYNGVGLFGALAGEKLVVLPARLVAFEDFANAHPDAEVLVPNGRYRRRYGSNPYVGYDTSPFPFLFDGETPEGIAPLARVVVVGDRAWSLEHLMEERTLRDGQLTLSWRPGQASALDTARISNGRDVGTVTAVGPGGDVPYKITFAFVWHAFNPDAPINGI